MKTIESEILDFATEQWGYKDLAGMALKFAEELGEIAGACVKIPEGRATFEDLDKEIGDALIVLSQMAATRGRTLDDLRACRFLQIRARTTILDFENASTHSPQQTNVNRF